MNTIIADFLQENTSQELLTESASVVHEMLKRKTNFSKRTIRTYALKPTACPLLHLFLSSI